MLKTRSDIRLYSKNFDKYLINLIKFYKLKYKLKKQKERIISTSYTPRYRLYSVSDLAMSGNTNDLYNYFNVLYMYIKSEEKFYNFVNNLNFKDKNYFVQKKNFGPENLFFSEFFKKLNKKINWTSSELYKKIIRKFYNN